MRRKKSLRKRQKCNVLARVDVHVSMCKPPVHSTKQEIKKKVTTTKKSLEKEKRVKEKKPKGNVHILSKRKPYCVLSRITHSNGVITKFYMVLKTSNLPYLFSRRKKSQREDLKLWESSNLPTIK